MILKGIVWFIEVTQYCQKIETKEVTIVWICCSAGEQKKCQNRFDDGNTLKSGHLKNGEENGWVMYGCELGKNFERMDDDS